MRKGREMRFLRILHILVAGILITNLTACGFTPVYGTNSQSAQALLDIQIAPPNTHEEYLFVRNIEDRLGRNPNAGMLLKYKIKIYGEGVNALGAARARLIGKVAYHVISLSTDEIIAKGSVENFAGYATDNLSYLSVKRDATDRLMQILANQTITDMMIKLQAN
jgi:LPS-assembly lipoprotein